MSHVLPLKRVARVRFSSVDKKTTEGEEPVRLCNYTDVYYRDSITPEISFMEATATPNELRDFSLHRGDVLITKDSESPDDIGIPAYVSFSDATVLCGYHLAQVRPDKRKADGRYLFWWMSSDVMRRELSSRANGITRFGLKLESIAAAPVRLPDMEEQRAIADFLDRETARIDALIQKKLRLVALAEEREPLLLAVAMRNEGFLFPDSLSPDWGAIDLPSGWRVIHLSQVLKELTNGYVGPTRDILMDEGVRYIQSIHIKKGLIDFHRRPFYVSHEWHHQRPRIHLRPGDVLIVQTGDIGQIAVVPDDIGEASCHALQIARVRQDVLTGHYLGEYLRSAFGYQSLLSRATGALHPHLEGGIRDVPVVVPPLSLQNEIFGEVVERRATHQELLRKIDVHVRLLQEHRHALITAAVTGQMDFPSAA